MVLAVRGDARRASRAVSRVVAVAATGAVVAPVAAFSLDQVLAHHHSLQFVVGSWVWPGAAIGFVLLAAGSVLLLGPRVEVAEPLPAVSWSWTVASRLVPVALVVLGRRRSRVLRTSAPRPSTISGRWKQRQCSPSSPVGSPWRGC